MNVMVFTNTLDGHHLEYIHHIYELAKNDVDNHYFFVLPLSFQKIRDKLIWSPAKHIEFDLFDEALINGSKPLYSSLLICRFVARAAKKKCADIIYSNIAIIFVPFAPLLIGRKHKLIGIIYRIYLHDIGFRSKQAILQDKLKYWIMSKFSVFYRLMILNDEESAIQLNRIYRTNKFIALPDPYVPISTNEIVDIRQNYSISKDKILFAHFGAMNWNKGTLELLRSLKNIPDEECEKYVFFLAGRVENDIKERLYALIEEIGNKVQIIVKDEYCSYEFFGSLCTACDAIVTPYKRTAQSSGLIGYASQFGKPVIAPDKGLLGQLVKKYGLGILIKDTTPDSLVSAYRIICSGDYKKPSKQYCEDNTIYNFQQTIKKCISL